MYALDGAGDAKQARVVPPHERLERYVIVVGDAARELGVVEASCRTGGGIRHRSHRHSGIG
jgi:hypothetical protein